MPSLFVARLAALPGATRYDILTSPVLEARSCRSWTDAAARESATA